MIFRILITLLAAALIYVTYEIIAAYSYDRFLQAPAASFMAMNEETGKIPVIQYMDLRCADCKKMALVVMDYAENNPDIDYVLRPIYPEGDDRKQESLDLLATGLQGHYWDAVRAVSQYDGNPDETFYRENASLIGIDFDRWDKDRKSPEILKIHDRNERAILQSQIKSTQALMIGRNLYYLQEPLTPETLSQMIEAERQKR